AAGRPAVAGTGEPADGGAFLARGPRRLVGRQGRPAAQRRPPRLRPQLDQARPAAAAEHLVADRRRLRRLPPRPRGGGSAEPEGPALEGDAREPRLPSVSTTLSLFFPEDPP